MLYFDKNLHTYACQYSLTTGMQARIFMDEGLLSIISVR